MLPFSFLRIHGMAPSEVKNDLILMACQMLKSHIPNAAMEISFYSLFWMINVQTDFKLFSIGPHLTGTLFNGRGGIKEGERNILSVFQAEFVLDPRAVGEDLMGASLDNPDEFLNCFGSPSLL